MPNESILINTLSLQAAKDSSAIENIITTHDELYRSDSNRNDFKSVASKEVYNYAIALRNAFKVVKQQHDNYYINIDLYNFLSNINLKV